MVGSGFGGAVAACRLAEAGWRVAILERGREWGRAGTPFPRGLGDDWLWTGQRGPFDLHLQGEVTAVTAAGYGGGSLLYSNVHLRAPAEAFAGWPAEWTRAGLDRYYDLVAHVLALRTIDQDEDTALPERTLRMQEVGRRHGREVVLPPLAVSFGPPEREFTNAYGRCQQPCNYCGNCSLGCNRGAKNSLDLTYLARAENARAHVGLESEVVGIRPGEDGGYTVTVRAVSSGEHHEIHGDVVVLGAGALGTTALLLRCREEGLLPDLSPRLGEGYSANGDLLGFALGTDAPFDPMVGPAITAAARWSGGDGPDDPWFLLQDGGIPPDYADAATHLLDAVDEVEDLAAVLLPERRADLLGRLWQLDDQPDEDDPRRTAVFLAMGRDTSDGTVHLDASGRPRIRWDTAANQRLYDLEQGLVDEFAVAMGADPVTNPGSSLRHVPVSVHNLGGAVMAASPAEGVVRPDGEVHGYDGLFVLDGAALPRATGTNPSHTIAAVAERQVERLIQRTDPSWEASDWPWVPRYRDPLGTTPAAPAEPPRRATTGARTRLGLHGALALVDGGALVRLDADALELGAVALGRRVPWSVEGALRLGGAWPAREVRVGTGVVEPGAGGPWSTGRWTLPFTLDGRAHELRGSSRDRDLHLRLHRGPDLLAVGVVTVDLWPALTATRLVPVPGLLRQGSRWSRWSR